MSRQQLFSAALLASEATCPPGLFAWNQSDPEGRFAVYRNNVIVSLIDALADSFPVTQELVGEEFFRGMAGVFVRAHPPHSPVLALYGDELAAFIETFSPASGLPYLAGVARLEFARVLACHAADVDPLRVEDISVLLADEAKLSRSRFVLHPSVGVLISKHAIVSLWAAHQSANVALALQGMDTSAGETALVLRSGLDVEVIQLPLPAAIFIEQLQQGTEFERAVELAVATDPGFDLTSVLGILIRGGAIIALSD